MKIVGHNCLNGKLKSGWGSVMEIEYKINTEVHQTKLLAYDEGLIVRKIK